MLLRVLVGILPFYLYLAIDTVFATQQVCESVSKMKTALAFAIISLSSQPTKAAGKGGSRSLQPEQCDVVTSGYEETLKGRR